jgi:hypothetical protein
MRNSFEILFSILKGNDRLGDLDQDGRHINMETARVFTLVLLSSVVTFYEYGNTLYISKNRREFLT